MIECFVGYTLKAINNIILMMLLEYDTNPKNKKNTWFSETFDQYIKQGKKLNTGRFGDSEFVIRGMIREKLKSLSIPDWQIDEYMKQTFEY